MNQLLIGLVSALVATNQPQAVSNLLEQHLGVTVSIPDTNSPEEKELQQLMMEDDDATAEVDKWIRDNDAFTAQGAGESKAELNKRIHARFDSVRKDYENFLLRYPNFARGHLAYGSFLNDLGDEETAMKQYEIARQLDPKNPAAWNNLAGYFCENGPLTNAFIYFAKASELNPAEPVYYENWATAVYLYRKDAEAFYGITEPQVFDKSLELYRKAVKLDPDNYPLATEYAQSYYGIKPLRTNDALVAWTNALNIAHNEVEREGVYIHLARIKLAAGFYDEARVHLAAVTNDVYTDLKTRLERNLAEREKNATNSISATATNQVSAISTNEMSTTNAILILTNQVPALTNPPVFSTNMVSALTNVPPTPPKPFALKASSATSNFATGTTLTNTTISEK
ncbi:MAG TPA: tetratricopeptide repeat protein [Verrucomicrobiae bacterium]|nr:tetratricopeptide repeat protein [Verrucomicrobiae bacterium]